jgi:hydrogenase maturation factor
LSGATNRGGRRKESKSIQVSLTYLILGNISENPNHKKTAIGEQNKVNAIGEQTIITNANGEQNKVNAIGEQTKITKANGEQLKISSVIHFTQLRRDYKKITCHKENKIKKDLCNMKSGLLIRLKRSKNDHKHKNKCKKRKETPEIIKDRNKNEENRLGKRKDSLKMNRRKRNHYLVKSDKHGGNITKILNKERKTATKEESNFFKQLTGRKIDTSSQTFQMWYDLDGKEIRSTRYLETEKTTEVNKKNEAAETFIKTVLLQSYFTTSIIQNGKEIVQMEGEPKAGILVNIKSESESATDSSKAIHSKSLKNKEETVMDREEIRGKDSVALSDGSYYLIHEGYPAKIVSDETLKKTLAQYKRLHNIQITDDRNSVVRLRNGGIFVSVEDPATRTLFKFSTRIVNSRLSEGSKLVERSVHSIQILSAAMIIIPDKEQIEVEEMSRRLYIDHGINARLWKHIRNINTKVGQRILVLVDNHTADILCQGDIQIKINEIYSRAIKLRMDRQTILEYSEYDNIIHVRTKNNVNILNFKELDAASTMKEYTGATKTINYKRSRGSLKMTLRAPEKKDLKLAIRLLNSLLTKLRKSRRRLTFLQNQSKTEVRHRTGGNGRITGLMNRPEANELMRKRSDLEELLEGKSRIKRICKKHRCIKEEKNTAQDRKGIEMKYGEIELRTIKYADNVNIKAVKKLQNNKTGKKSNSARRQRDLKEESREEDSLFTGNTKQNKFIKTICAGSQKKKEDKERKGDG